MTTTSGTVAASPLVPLDQLGDLGEYGRRRTWVRRGRVDGDDDQPLRRPGLRGDRVEDLAEPADPGGHGGAHTAGLRVVGLPRTTERVLADEEHGRHPRNRRPPKWGRGRVGVHRLHSVGRRERRRHEAGYVGVTR